MGGYLQREIIRGREYIKAVLPAGERRGSPQEVRMGRVEPTKIK